MLRTITHRRTQTGFSIVELMVGTVVAMLAILVIFNAFAMFEGQKRSTTSTNDLQATGMLALQAIEHDVRMAGYGLTVSVLGATFPACSTAAGYINAYQSGAATTIPAAPIGITDGGSGSDKITVMYSTSAFAATPAMLAGGVLNSSLDVTTSNTATDPLCTTDPTKCVFRPGDYLLVAQPSLGKPCSRLRVTGTVNGATLTVQHATSDAVNPPAATNIFPPAAGTYPAGYDDAATDPAVVINMGAMIRTLYAVSNNSLTSQDLTAVGGTAVNLASGVVLMKAQYGVATSGVADQSVDSWMAATDCTAAAGSGWSTKQDPINTALCFPTAAHVPLVKAIRVAVVVRSSLLEKDNVTFTCTNNAGVNNGPCAWADTSANKAPLVDLSADPNWQRYRYRVFETIIPLRNVLWANI